MVDGAVRRRLAPVVVCSPVAGDGPRQMHSVEVSRFVRATLPAVERRLSPAAVVEYEGTFTVTDVQETGDGWIVTGRGGGLLEARFAFEEREDGYVYRQEGDAGPFEEMETRLRLSRRDEGVEVTAQSAVSLGVPLPLVDHVAAWKRRGELRRALSRLAADVE